MSRAMYIILFPDLINDNNTTDLLRIYRVSALQNVTLLILTAVPRGKTVIILILYLIF